MLLLLGFFPLPMHSMISRITSTSRTSRPRNLRRNPTGNRRRWPQPAPRPAAGTSCSSRHHVLQRSLRRARQRRRRPGQCSLPAAHSPRTAAPTMAASSPPSLLNEGVHPSGVPRRTAGACRVPAIPCQRPAADRLPHLRSTVAATPAIACPTTASGPSFGTGHFFHIGSLPPCSLSRLSALSTTATGWTLMDPWPEDWPPLWYESDNVYIDWGGDGYYLYDTNYPASGWLLPFLFEQERARKHHESPMSAVRMWGFLCAGAFPLLTCRPGLIICAHENAGAGRSHCGGIGVAGAARAGSRCVAYDPRADGPLPRPTVWAWERREDLRAVDPATTAVAWPDRMVVLMGAGWGRARRQALLLPASAGAGADCCGSSRAIRN